MGALEKLFAEQAVCLSDLGCIDEAAGFES